MPKKERTFAAKLAHEARVIYKEVCTVCGKEKIPVVYIAAQSGAKNTWRPQRRRIKVCDCNRNEIYG
jgi:cytochrome c5